MSIGNTILDNVFRAFFPHHNMYADQHVEFVGNSTREVYTTILDWLDSVLIPQREHRTMTLELQGWLELIADGLRQVLAGPIPSTLQVDSEAQEARKVATSAWIEVQCQQSCYEFMARILDLEYINLEERYSTKCISRHQFNALQPYVTHILHRIRYETEEYILWKRWVESGDKTASRAQPPSPWNWVIQDVSRFAALVVGDGLLLPEPLTFEKIMYILEQTEARMRNATRPGSFPTAQELANKLDDEDALRMLVHDFWAVELRWSEYPEYSKCHRDLVQSIRNVVAPRYAQVAVSASGMPIAVWRDNEVRIDIGTGDRSYMRFGVPSADAVSRTVHETYEELVGDLDALQWRVDIAWVRNNVVIDWGVLGKYEEHRVGPGPPSYDELFGRPPPSYDDTVKGDRRLRHRRLFRWSNS